MNNRILSNTLDFDYLSSEEKKTLHQKLLYCLYKSAIRHPLTINRLDKLSNFKSEMNIDSAWKEIAPQDSEDHRFLIKEYFSHVLSLSESKKSAIVFSSGGMRGSPISTCLSFEEVMRNASFQGKGYFTAGIRPHHTVATFGIPSLLSSEFTVYHGLRETSCLILPIGIVNDPKNIVNLIEEFSANVLLVMPSDLIPILQYLEVSNKYLPKIQLIVTGGEKLRADLMDRIKKTIGSENIKFRSTFQTSDIGTIGYQCDYLENDEYHVHEELQYAEIIKDEDEDTVLVVTNLDRYFFPVIRLKTGDLASWINSERCRCGRTSNIIKLHGRKSHTIKIGGEKFDQEILYQIPHKFKIPIETCAWQLRINCVHQEELVFKILKPLQELINIKQIEEEIIKSNPKFSAQLFQNIITLKTEELLDSDITYSTSGKRKILIDSRSLK